MKFFFRLFFKVLRLIIGPLLLLWEMITRPPGQARLAAVQEAVDRQCRSMVLYQYRSCPFCIKVRQEMCRLSLNIEHLDAQPDGRHRDDLVCGGGQAKVPCLKITDPAGNSQWLYESSKIVDYLRGRFAGA